MTSMINTNVLFPMLLIFRSRHCSATEAEEIAPKRVQRPGRSGGGVSTPLPVVPGGVFRERWSSGPHVSHGGVWSRQVRMVVRLYSQRNTVSYMLNDF